MSSKANFLPYFLERLVTFKSSLIINHHPF
jgi:hypothetical protein